MPREAWWRWPLIVVIIALAILAAYPTQDTIVRTETVTEVNGIETKRERTFSSWQAFVYARGAEQRTTILSDTQEKQGDIVRYVRQKQIDYVARGRVKLGLDLRGGSELQYRVRVGPKDRGAGLTNITRNTIGILEKRIDPQGVLEYRIQQQGPERILIQVPGATKREIERLKERIIRMGKLEFRLCTTDEGKRADARKGRPVPGYYVHWVEKLTGERGDWDSERWYLVSNRIELTGERLAHVFPDVKQLEPVVGFQFDTRGSKIFARITERNINSPLAIILDGRLVSAPTIQSRISGRGIIEGSFTQEKVNDMIATLRAGSLPADLELEMENFVGPSLGLDSIQRGVRAIVIAGVLIVSFMAVYYWFAGCVADAALFMNLLLVIGMMALLKATLTLPGLAGMLLTIGMAVDANVLIFERIREEKEKGKLLRVAVKDGYQRAFLTIVDANLTTLITALILYAVGTGPVKGFAVTLSAGIVFSMFTALFVTRVVFETFMAKEWITELRMLRLLGKSALPFINWRRKAFVVSAAGIAIGMATFIARGADKFDIDFTGGNLIHIRLGKPTVPDEVRKIMNEMGYGKAEIQGMWTGEEGKREADQVTDFGIRIKGLNTSKAREKTETDIRHALGPNQATFSYSAPMTYTLGLSTPMTEAELRKTFARAGYTDEDIKDIVASDMPDSYYEVSADLARAGVGTEEEARRMYGMIIDQLRPRVQQRNVTLTFGLLKEVSVEDAGKRPGKAALVSTLDLNTNSRSDGAVIAHALDQKGFPGLSVYERGGTRRSQMRKAFIVRGGSSAVERLKMSSLRALDLPSIEVRDRTTIRFHLPDSMVEAKVRTDVLGGTDLADLATRVVSLTAKSKLFDVRMAALRQNKIQEKIRADITGAFRGNLYAESIRVRFEDVVPSEKSGATEADAPPSTEEKKAKAADGLRVVLETPQPFSKIREVLDDAGCADALMGEYNENQKYKQVLLRKPADADDTQTMKEAVQKAFVSPDPLRRVVSIGAAVAGEMKSRAVLAVLFAMGAVVFYIWFRFGEFRFGAAAVIALTHDVLATLGAIALGDWIGGQSWAKAFLLGDIKINLPVVAAILTIIGYSLNDTIVVFDRIRENLGGSKRGLNADLLNTSINQTLSRTLLTSATTLVAVLCLYFLGGPVIHGFAFALIVGVIVGTYSSVFIASPVLVEWDNIRRGVGLFFRFVTFPVRAVFLLFGSSGAASQSPSADRGRSSGGKK